MAVSLRTHHACCRRFGSFHIGDILSICSLLYQYVSFSKNSLSVLFPFLCRSDIGKDTTFFVTFQIYELLFLLFAAFFLLSIAYLIYNRAGVGGLSYFCTFAPFAPLHPLQHICSQSERRIRRLRRPARRGVRVAIGDRIKKKIFVGMCVFRREIKKNNQQIFPHWVIADCFKASNVKLNITYLQLPHSWRALQTQQAVRH